MTAGDFSFPPMPDSAPAVHIHSPAPTSIFVQVKYRRGRRWYDHGTYDEIGTAEERAAAVLLSSNVKAARVLCHYEWYDPSVVWQAEKV